MYGGEISRNSGSSSATGYVRSAGGVWVGGQSGISSTEETFIMDGGVISGNSASPGSSYGAAGGVFLYGSPRFAKTGGTIYGYDEGDTENSNVVKNLEEIIQNKGHAVCVYNTTYSKETTLGPDDRLFYKYPTDSDISGWD
jgi:hypothetical protein